jgi:GNAT superfamily N-acetyltransferase
MSAPDVKETLIKLLRSPIALSRARSSLAYLVDMSRSSLRGSSHSGLLATLDQRFLKLRPALPDDLDALDALARRAKAHWGYAAEDLERWANELRLDPATLPHRPTLVAEREGVVAGFMQIDPTREPWVLDALWVDPLQMGRGVGRRLLIRACELAAQAGQADLAIDADPNAAAFYARQGATLIGWIDAPVVGDPGRRRPQFLLPTTRATQAATPGANDEGTA